MCRGILLAGGVFGFAGLAASAQSPDEAPAKAVMATESTDDASADDPAPATPPEPGFAPQRIALEIEDLRGLLEGRLPQHVPLVALFEIDLADENAVQQRVEVLRQRIGESAADPLDLRRERNRLRLAFLSLPVETRTALREQDRVNRDDAAMAEEHQAAAAALASTEQARDQALAEARNAADGRARWLATEEARLLAHRSELAALRQSWAMGNQDQVTARRALLARYAAVDSGAALSPGEADALYVTIREDLRALRKEARRALTALSEPSVVPGLEAAGDGSLLDAPTLAAAQARLAPLRKAIADEQAELRLREADERYADAQNVMNTLGTLQAHRVALLRLMSPSARREVTGLTSAGWERVTSEISHVRLMARWYPVQRLHTVRDFAALMHDPLNAGRFGAGVLAVLVTLAVVLMARVRSARWLTRLRTWMSVRVQPRSLMLRLDSLMKMLIAIVPELTLLAAVYLLFEHLFPGRSGVPELGTLRQLAYAYAWYALALAFIHRVLLTAVSRYRAVSPVLNRKILGSLRLVARLALAVGVYLILAQALLGRGALYGIARNVALIGAFLVGWRLISNWRAEVTMAYLRMFPRGSLAEHVRASQSRSHGLLVASAAFVFVAARGLWVWLRDLAMSFEQTRKALAYLFRRRLERQSKNQSATPDPRLLPQALQDALAEDPAPESLCIDHYPQLAEVAALATALAEGRNGGLVALTGERGTGKTTWLHALERGVDPSLRCRRHSFDERLPDAAAVCRTLCRALELAETDDPQILIAQVLAGPPQVVMLDLCHNLMLRTVGGLAGYELFVRVAEATVRRVLWIAVFARWPFEYLQRLHPGRDVFDRTVTLGAWPEDKISALLVARMEAAGFTADYDQLLLNIPGLAPALASSQLEVAASNADRYHRLIWDYADGNPRIALHFFRLSLTWTAGTKVTVRLFPQPSIDALEGFKPRTHFVLSCLVQHENLTPAEAADSLRFPRAECARALDLLHQHEFLGLEAGTRYRVNSHWNRAVQRFLQRKKMLVV